MTWKDWVSLSYRKRIEKLRNGIPYTENDTNYLEDLSVYANYLTKDVFNSFLHRKATRLYHSGTSRWEKAFTSEAKAAYYDIFKQLAKNIAVDVESVNRVSTSFPFSISHTGEVLKDVIDTEDDKKSTNFNTPLDDTKASEINEQKPDGTYIAYLDYSDPQTWHSSYNYLMDVISERVEVPKCTLQQYVADIEKELF